MLERCLMVDYGVYADKFQKQKMVSYELQKGKHAKELKKVYKNKKDANDYIGTIMIAKGGWVMKTFKQMYYEDGQQRQTNCKREKQSIMRNKTELERIVKPQYENKRKRKRKEGKKKEQQQRQSQTENAPSLAVLKKKIKSGTKLGSTETASAKARGLIPRADGTKRKSDKYK